MMISTTSDNVLPDVEVQATPITQPAIQQGTSQFLRRWSVVVHDTSGAVLELSAGTEPSGQGTATGIPITNPQGQILSEGLRMQMKSYAADIATPGHAEITVWNLKAETAARVSNHEFAYVVVQAGYVNGRYGVVFSGTIVQTKRGRFENSVDTYLIIYALDGEWPHNNWLVNKGDGLEFPRDSTRQQQITVIRDDAVKNGGVSAGVIQSAFNLNPGVLPRGTVRYGLGANALTTAAGPYTQFSIQNGTINIRDLGSYTPGEAVVLNAQTGLIGVPESTEQGIETVCLCNPSIKVKGLIRINNADINQTSEPPINATTVQTRDIGYPNYTGIHFFASTAADGVYVVLVVQYELDTRGNPWYTKTISLLVDVVTQELAPAASPTTQTIEEAFDNARGSGQAIEFTLPTS